MRTARTLAVCLALALGVASQAAIRTVTLKVESMATREAAQKLTAALKAVPGVQDAAADPSARIAMVRFDSARTSVLDIGDAAAEAGHPATLLTGAAAGNPQAALDRSLENLKDFDQVLAQVREARKDGRYGLVRNLMPALKLRADAVVAGEKAVARTRGRSTTNPYDLALALSRSAASLAAAGEARDKPKVDQLLPEVRQAFKKLADARNFDEAVAPAETAAAQPKSLEEQLLEKLKSLAK